MGCVQQEVLDFDEEIQRPWRPRLVAVAGGSDDPGVRPLRAHSSGRSSSRVGVCRPPEPLTESAAPARRAAGTSAARTDALRARVAPPGASSGRAPSSRRPGTIRPGARGVRLTRRARRLAVVLTLAAGVAVGSWLGPLLAGSGGDLHLAGVQSVVVQPGDTLWSIASVAAGSGDVREVVDHIQELNGLQGTVLLPGQVLELP
ncbi:LysM peptidoglycan-binding domain-containing protein [Blastococcus sp. CT_GayMR16]|uniref:LysM peptidoglycan-binding domain-containing protein n=1 Tax=Blastococcus sp. CT_GayMR16 TaxID=2559607 RepID=UPI001073E491|nr:LysM peptidoglycan-binding domain-containing protein [Blastococcus sp. CT_GayMR16]TFV86830.1 LysM peptidoglycan-binding domain-containing protein [Blastococcus sp. CT_GayMR16]